MRPYLIDSPCNWLQVMENAWDPFHTVYLHTKAVRSQFIDAFAELPGSNISQPKSAISIQTQDAWVTSYGFVFMTRCYHPSPRTADISQHQMAHFILDAVAYPVGWCQSTMKIQE